MTYARWSSEAIATVREMKADGKSGREIAEAVGRTLSSVHALFGRFGDHEARTKPRSDIPADLREKWEVMSHRALAAHYGVSLGTASAWCHRSGLVRNAAWRSPEAEAKVKARTPPVRIGIQRKPDIRSAATVTVRDLSPAGQAAEYLRQFGPVYRCNDRGVPDFAGKLWRRGSAILTDAELIERAEGNRRREAARRAA